MAKRYLVNAELEEIANRRAQANAEISKLCSGEKSFRMCIPPQDDDSDVILQNVLDDEESLINEVYRLRGGIKRLYINSKGKLSEDVRAELRSLIFDEEIETNGS